MQYPRLALAANRAVGMGALQMLLREGWHPTALLLPKPGDHNRDMIELAGVNTPVLLGKEFRSPGGLELLRSLDLDYLLSVHFPLLVPKEVLRIPREGCLNLHPAYLPFNRGWHTPSWAILEETPYGATLHWMSEGVDEGDIALQELLAERPDDTADSLYRRVLKLELKVLGDAIPLMKTRSVPRTPQNHEQATVHRRQDLNTHMHLDLDELVTVRTLLRRLRALTTNSWKEAAYFEDNGRMYRIRVDIRPELPHDDDD